MKRRKREPLNPTLNVLGRTFGYVMELVSNPSKLNLTKFPPPEDTHETQTARRLARRAKGSSRVFDVVAVEGPSIPDPIDLLEEEANALVTYLAGPIVSGTHVLYRHDLVQLAIREGKPITVYRLTERLPDELVLPLQARYASREKRLVGVARAEVARILFREYGMQLKEIRTLLQGPKGAWNQKAIENQIRVADLFEEWTGEPIGFSKQGPKRHNFSAILEFVEQAPIKASMDESPDARKRWVEIAINSAESGTGRVQDDLTQITKRSDNLEVLFREGVSKARAYLRANYPETARDVFPLNDLEAALAKLQNPEVQRILSKQFENQGGRKFFSVVTEIAATTASINTAIANRLVDSIAGTNRESVISWVASNAQNEVLEKMQSMSDNLHKFNRAKNA